MSADEAEILALTKTVRDGRTATVHIRRGISGPVVTVARLEGKDLGNHCGPHHLRPGLPEGYVAAVGKLALTQEEADQVKAAYDAFVAALPRNLHAERRALVAAVIEAEDMWTDTRAYEHDHSDGSGRQFRHDAANEARIKTAQEALRAFDAEHPEIKAEVAAKRAQDVERWSLQ